MVAPATTDIASSGTDGPNVSGTDGPMPSARRPASVSMTVIILTYNEEIHIERCITRIAPLVERIIVVDSFSTDATVEIARRVGAQVHQRAFKNQAEQFQWALDTIKIDSAWTLRLDADEYLEDALIAELRAELATLPATVTGLRIKRKVYFRGRWIRWGGYYPTVLLRIWRSGACCAAMRSILSSARRVRWRESHTCWIAPLSTTFISASR